jgi:hypothetical protein
MVNPGARVRSAADVVDPATRLGYEPLHPGRVARSWVCRPSRRTSTTSRNPHHQASSPTRSEAPPAAAVGQSAEMRCQDPSRHMSSSRHVAHPGYAATVAPWPDQSSRSPSCVFETQSRAARVAATPILDCDHHPRRSVRSLARSLGSTLRSVSGGAARLRFIVQREIDGRVQS